MSTDTDMKFTTWEEAAAWAADSLSITAASPWGNDPSVFASALDKFIGNGQDWDVPFVARMAARGLQLHRGVRTAPTEEDVRSLVDLLARKQHDYGHGNINRFGLKGVKVRISDKACRLVNLFDRGDGASNESIKDSFIDIIGYCVIAVMLENGVFDLPLSTDVEVAAEVVEPERYLVWRHSSGFERFYDLDSDDILAARKIRKLLKNGEAEAVTLRFKNGSSGTWTIEAATDEVPF